MTARILFAVLFALSFAAPALAEETKPDDIVAFDLSAEDWVTTKTAHVTVNVEAAVSATNAGSMREDMAKAVGDAAKGDWRLTNFTRTQDSTGLEHWSVSFDSRLPESALNSLPDSLKKASKAGMQMSVGDIDFSPTLDETEATRAGLRARLVKNAVEQVATLNTSLPGRSYRIAQIAFDSAGAIVEPRILKRPMMMSAMAVSAPSSEGAGQEHAQKMTMTAHVVYAAIAPTAAHNQ